MKSKPQPTFYRAVEIERLRRNLIQTSYPRAQMCLLVLITGAAGFLASFGMLKAGLVEMWVRYLCAFGVAYLVFLLLLWLWLRTNVEDYGDVGDLGDVFPSSSRGGGSGSNHTGYVGKGGTVDGGGASANFDHASFETPVLPQSDGGAIGDAFGDTLGAAADADELAIPLVILVLVAALLLSSAWVVYSAPVLFAELLVDGVLAASLYRRLRGLRTRHWLLTAVRRTLWPFVLTALVAAGAGWWMKQIAPEAHSIGDVIYHRVPRS
jgi:hypothetical protein